jgi:hypothetical protein
MKFFTPHLEILPLPQKMLWAELHATPEYFTLYGGTALALHLGHRKSVDFDFFSRMPFEANDLMRSIPYLEGAERIDVSKNNLTCRVDRDGGVKMQFFGGLSLGSIEPRQQPTGAGFWVASLIDVAGTKVKVLPERSEAKDYLDVDALLQHGMDLPTMLGAANAIYGRSFNPVLSLKALTYFADVSQLPDGVKERLTKASLNVDLAKIPTFMPVQPVSTMGKGNGL